MMKLKDIQREKHEVQRRIDFLQKLNKFDTLDDLELLKEMKIELRRKMDNLLAAERKAKVYEEKRQHLEKASSRILPVFSTVIFVLMFIMYTCNRKIIDNNFSLVLAFSFMINLTLLCMNISISYSVKRKSLLILVILFLALCYVIQFITGYNPLKYAGELYITFGFSLFSFLNSMIRGDKKDDAMNFEKKRK